MINKSTPGRLRGRVLGATMTAAVLLAGCGSGEIAAKTDAAAPAQTDQADNQPDAEPSAGTESSPPSDNDRAPGLVVNTINGGQVDFADILGQDTVLWFWAPW